MKKVFVLSAAAAVLLALSAYQNVWSKAHVPLHKVQVCHQGDPVEVITVSSNALSAHLGHGDCQVPACDFNNIFQTGDDCSDLGGADEAGHCTELGERDSAEGITDACPVGSF